MQKQSDPIVSIDSCPQDKRVSGFQRFYHVTEPFIKRLGLETELQVSDSRCLQTAKREYKLNVKQLFWDIIALHRQ